jgi:predicted PurR-regulated permease PerM
MDLCPCVTARRSAGSREIDTAMAGFLRGQSLVCLFLDAWYGIGLSLILAFGSLFGFTGLITAVPFAAAAGVILRFAVKRYRESNLYTSLSGPRPKILLESRNPDHDGGD